MNQMRYRICKQFEIESGHMLSKHPGRCRFPHGHSRRIEVVLSAEQLDASDMVCDFKAIKVIVAECLDDFDHAMAINSADRLRPVMEQSGQRLVIFEDEDPTTEVLARHLFNSVAAQIRERESVRNGHGLEYRFPQGLILERVRVWETSSSWAEYGIDECAGGSVTQRMR